MTALSKYIKSPAAGGNLTRYTDVELRKIELALSSLLSFTLEGFEMADTETGVFTPILVGGGTPGVGTYTTQQGTFFKIGKLVLAQFHVVTTAHTGTGRVQLSNLPFKVRAGGFFTGMVFSGATIVSGPLLAIGGTTTADFYGTNPAGVHNIINAMDLICSIAYLTD